MSGSTVSVKNNLNQSLDTLYDPASGDGKLKVGVGDVVISGDTEVGAWQGVATHAEGATFEANDGLVVMAGIDDDPGTGVAVPLRVDAAGRLSTGSSGSLVDAGDLDLSSGGVAETLFAANPDRKYLLIQNNTGGDVWVDFGTTAVLDSPSIKIADGGSMEYGGFGGFVPTQSVSWIASSAVTITAKEG